MRTKYFLLLAFILVAAASQAQNFNFTRHYPTDSTKVSGLVNGKIWYCSVHNRFEAYENGAVVALRGSGGEGGGVSLQQKDVSTTTYTVTDADNGYWINFTNASGCDVTFDDGVSANTAVYLFRNAGAGPVQAVAGGTATLNAYNDEYTIEVENGVGFWFKRDATNWDGSVTLASAAGNIQQRTETGTTYTVTDADDNYIIHLSSAVDITVNFPNTVSDDTYVTFVRDDGAGKVTFTATGTSEIAAVGVPLGSIDTVSILYENGWASWVKDGATSWYGTGILGELSSGGGGGAVSSVFGRTGGVVAAAGDYEASEVTNTPAGSIAADDVQEAINELDTEKQPLDSDLTTIAGLTATTDNFLVSVSSAWASRTPAQVKTTLSLNNVENTALSTWAGSTNITTLGTIATGNVPWGRLSSVPEIFTRGGNAFGAASTLGLTDNFNLTVATGTASLIFRNSATDRLTINSDGVATFENTTADATTGGVARFNFGGVSMGIITSSGSIKFGSAATRPEIGAASNYSSGHSNTGGGISYAATNSHHFGVSTAASISTGSRTVHRFVASMTSAAANSNNGKWMEFVPTINVTAGTPNLYILDINPTETAIGSALYYGIVNRSTTASNGFATATPTSTLESAQSFAAGYATTSADLTLTATHHTVTVDASGANRTITLPPAAGCTRRIYVVKKIDSSGNTVTIDANASETIDGATTKVLSTQYAGVTIQSDGTNWHIIGAF